MSRLSYAEFCAVFAPPRVTSKLESKGSYETNVLSLSRGQAVVVVSGAGVIMDYGLIATLTSGLETAVFTIAEPGVLELLEESCCK